METSIIMIEFILAFSYIMYGAGLATNSFINNEPEKFGVMARFVGSIILGIFWPFYLGYKAGDC